MIDCYIDKKDKCLKKYDNLSNCNGVALSNYIYSLSSLNDLINDDYNKLIDAISTITVECNPLEFKANAHILCGTVKLNNEEKILNFSQLINQLKHIRICSRLLLIANLKLYLIKS